VIETRLRTRIQLALASIGLVVWGYGVRADDSRLRWVGIALFAVAAALRFLRNRADDQEWPG